MNEFSIITYGFKENQIKRCMEEWKISAEFQTISTPEDLYDYVRIETIYKLQEVANLEREKLISADGPANYLRPVLNQMDDDTYQLFVEYHLATCERTELLGAAAHTVDILRRRD